MTWKEVADLKVAFNAFYNIVKKTAAARAVSVMELVPAAFTGKFDDKHILTITPDMLSTIQACVERGDMSANDGVAECFSPEKRRRLSTVSMGAPA